jgi:hypothetical protein
MINLFFSISLPEQLFKAGLIGHADLNHAIFILPKRYRMLLSLNRIWARKVPSNKPPTDQDRITAGWFVAYEAIDKAILEGRVLYANPNFEIQELNDILVKKFDTKSLPVKGKALAPMDERTLIEYIDSTESEIKIITRYRGFYRTRRSRLR